MMGPKPLELHEQSNPLPLSKEGRKKDEKPESKSLLVLVIVGVSMIVGVVVISLIIMQGSVDSIKEQIYPLAHSISSNIVSAVAFKSEFQEMVTTVNFNSWSRGEIALETGSYSSISQQIMGQMFITTEEDVTGIYSVLPCEDNEYCAIGASPLDDQTHLWVLDKSTSYKRTDYKIDDLGHILDTIGTQEMDITARPWFKTATETEDGKFGQSPPYLDADSGEWCVSIVRPSYTNGNIESIFVVDIELQKFSTTLKKTVDKIESDEGINAFLIDSNKNLYAASNDGVESKIRSKTDALITTDEVSSKQLEFGMIRLQELVPDLSDFPDTAVLKLDLDLDYVVIAEKVNKFISLVVIPREDFYKYISQCTTIIVLVTVVLVCGVIGTINFLAWKSKQKRRNDGKKQRSYSVIHDSRNPPAEEETNWNIVIIVIGTTSALLCAYVIWYFAALSAMDGVVSKLTSQIEHAISDDIAQFTKSPFDVIKFNMINYNTGHYRGNRELITKDFFYRKTDRIFVDRMKETTSPTYVFAVNDDNILEGALTINDEIHIGAYDDSTGDVYKKMGLISGESYRDRTKVVDESKTYVPIERPYYMETRARDEGTFAWSDVYIFADGSVGSTLTSPYNGNTWNPPGLFAVDITLEAISTFLSQLDLGEATSVAYIIDRDGLMVASSEGTITGGSDCDSARLAAVDSATPLVSRSAKGLINKNDLKTMKSFAGTLWRGHADGEILTEAVSITTNSLDWIIVLAFEKSDFFDTIEDKMDRAFLMGMGVTAIAVYFTAVMAMVGAHGGKDDDSDSLTDDLMFFESTRNELLRIYKKTVYALVRQGRLKQSVLESRSPSQKEEEMAFKFIMDGKNDINILDTMYLLQKGRHLALKIMRFRSSRLFKWLLNFVLIIHLCLILAECPDDELPINDIFDHNGILAIEGLLLLFHVSDLIFLAFNNGFFLAHMTKKQEIRVIPNFSEMIRCGLVLGMVLDWCYRIFIDDYEWGNGEMKLYLPYTCLLRPLLLVVCNPTVVRACKSFVATLFFARDVFIMFGCFLIVGAVVATIMIDDAFYDFGESKIRGFTDARASFLTMFVFLTSAENYPDVVHPPADNSYYYNIFFFFFSMIGMFLLSSLVIAIFETKYSDRHGQSEKLVNNNRRLAYISAFIALDKNCSGDLSINEFKHFLGSNVFTDTTFTLNIIEFVELVEQILDRLDYSGDKKQLMRPKKVSTNENSGVFAVRGWLHDFYCSTVHRRLMLFITVVYMWVLSLYGVYDSNTLDLYSLCFMIIFALEILGRIFAFGWTGYWHRPDDVYMEMGNRYDLFIATLSLVAYVASWIIQGSPSFNEVDPSRVALAIPIFRIFSVVDSIKVLFFAMLRTVAVFTDVAILLLVVFYEFGAVGCVVFGGKISELDDDTYDMLTANFDSTLKAFGTLFQLMVGEAWSSVMYAGIDAVGMMSMVYFILWTLIISLLFTNLIVGIVCNSFEKVDNLRQEKGDGTISTREMNDALKEESMSSSLRFLKVKLSVDPNEPVELIRTQSLGDIIESEAHVPLDVEVSERHNRRKKRRESIRQSIMALTSDTQRAMLQEEDQKKHAMGEISAKDLALKRRMVQQRTMSNQNNAVATAMNPLKLNPMHRPRPM